MKEKKRKFEVRQYTVSEISGIFVILIIFVLLFDSTGLESWADRLHVGPSRTFFSTLTGVLDSFAEGIRTDRPRDYLRSSFLTATGKKREAGFRLADESPDPENWSSLSTATGDEIGSWINSPNFGSTEPARPSDRLLPTTGVFSPDNPLKVLLIGDSMMADGFGTMMESALEADESTTVLRQAHHSTGLSRPDYFNWPAQVWEIFARKDYDAVVVILGTNDAQNFEVDGVVYNRFDEGWSEIYHERLVSFINLLTSRTQRVYWVGMPTMREPDYNGRMQKLNGFFEEACSLNPEATYVSSVEILGGSDGGFASYLTVGDRQINTRHNDGIHLTRAGGELIANHIMDLLQNDFTFEKTENPEPMNSL